MADARSELDFLASSKTLSDADGEVAKALAKAKAALDAYLTLAPAEQVEQARRILG